MATAFQFGFGSPETFSDWAGYAGLDRKTGEFAAFTPDTGIAPPTTLGELFEQKAIAPVQKSWDKVKSTGNMIANTANQISQGNAVGAYNAAKGVKPVTASPMPSVGQQTQEQGDWGFQSHID